MPRIPRDVSGKKLVQFLKRYDYKVVRQVASHIRLVSMYKGVEHKITIPDHRGIKIGTLNSILADVANYLEITKENFVEELFGR